MKTAGVVIDFYDDIGGATLKEAFPSADVLPDVIKTAHILSSEEREILRDEAFALRMQDEGRVIRKFACVDPGNTLLSMIYFQKTAAHLPEVAQRVAYDNITDRAIEFGLIHGKLKTAAGAKGMQRTRDSMRQPIVGEDADWASRTNLVSVRGGADAGRVIPTVNQMKTAGVEQALAKGKDLATKGWAAAKPHVDKAVGFVKAHPKASAGLAGAGIVAGRMSKQSSVVDVTGQEPETVFEQRPAEHMALGKYPLDSYADIREAARYFDQTWTEMDPPDRHEFAKAAAVRADAIGLDLSDVMSRYGSVGYAPDVEAHLASRKLNCDSEFHELYDGLKEKRAEIEPEEFAKLLAEVDELSGLNNHWGGHVSDPWFSTFGGRSTKEKVAFSWEANGVSVDAEALHALAGNKDLLMSAFDKTLVDGFMKDPVTIFESLPDDAKTILANLANG